MSTQFEQVITQEFQHLKSLYFNSAYFGPSPARTKKYVLQALDRELDPSFYPYPDWFYYGEVIRDLVAQLLHCSADAVALSTSVSDIVSMVANGYQFSAGDIVCSLEREYPSNVLSWMQAQKFYPFQLKLLPSAYPTADWLREHLPLQTEIFNLSHVAFDTGRRVDLISIGRLMQERGILFVVDATQSLGGLSLSPEELRYIDVLACSTYKWMLGPYGAAFAYFSAKALEKIHHKNGNWIVSPNSKNVYSLLDYTTETLPGARKFDRGQAPNMLAMNCFEASLRLLLELGLKNIENKNASLRDYFLSLVSRKDYQLMTPTELMGNIICLKSMKKDSADLERDLKKQNIDVSVREGNIRLSFHLFNTLKQVETLIQTLVS